MCHRNSITRLALSSLLFASIVSAEPGLQTLQKNPFSRPDILKAKPRSQTRLKNVVIPPEEIELDLTATMVSETSPMVVVDGEFLTIGDKIEGFKLIAVMEGKAIFTQGGKRYSFSVADDDDAINNNKNSY